MARMRRRDQMKDDPVGDYNETKAGLDEAIMSYQSGETVSTGEVFPVVRGGAKAEAAPESYFGEMSITERAKPAKSADLARGTFNNDDVRALQSSLKDISAFMGDKSLDPGTVDADFGGNTENAVKSFQNRFGLEVTGVVDSDTMNAIRSTQADLAMGRKKVGPQNLAEFRTAGVPMTPAQELRLTRQASAKFVPGQFDMAEDQREATVDRLGETDLFAPPPADRLKTSRGGPGESSVKASEPGAVVAPAVKNRQGLAEMRTTGARMTPAQELRLTRQAAAKAAPDQFDMREDFLEAQAAGRAEALEQARKAEDLMKRMEARLSRQEQMELRSLLGYGNT